MRWTGHVAHVGAEGSVYGVFVGNPERKKPLSRPRRKWQDNIKINFREREQGSMDWINVAQDGEEWRALVIRL
jgi:hypothetical protein